MLSRICFLVNTNLYDSKRHFVQKFAEAWIRKGVKVLIIDWENFEEKSLIFDKIIKFQPHITCSFNTIFPIGNEFLWDKIKIPHLAFLVDPAYYSSNLIQSHFSIISCVDRKDCAYIKSLNFDNVLFLPHAIERDLTFSPDQERPIDVVFLGSFNDFDAISQNWQKKYSAKTCITLETAANYVLSNTHLSLLEAFNQAQKEYPFEESVNLMSLFTDLDTYTRGKDRVELINAIKDPKIKIHIFGHYEKDRADSCREWKDVLGHQKNVIIHPSIPYKKHFEILKQSKICLNSMPFFKDGSHERIIGGLACGALPITSSSIYIEEAFKNKEELLTYQPKQWDKVEGQIRDLLENEEMRREMVRRGRENVMANHTWDSRVEYLSHVLPNIILDIIAR